MTKARPGASFRIMLMPILVLALGAAVVAWTAAWFFRDQFVFAAVFVGIGCLPIVIAVVAYLLILLKKV